MSESLVFISGASSGIGLALSETCPFPAARILDLSRRGAPGREHVKCDLATPEGWRVAARSFERELQGFAGARVVFVHSAGTLEPIGFAGEVDAGAYAHQVLLNAASPQIVGDAFLRAARSCEAPCFLVMISSGAAHSVYEGWSAYGAGKAALDHWVRIAGAEQARRGDHCRVAAVAPGVVATAMQEQIRETPAQDFPTVDRFVELHETGALRAPEDAARDIWQLVARGYENGAVLDLRDVAEGGG